MDNNLEKELRKQANLCPRDAEATLFWQAANALEDCKKLVEAVAHIGVDFGYGKFELDDEHVSKARELLETLNAGEGE